MSLGAGPEFVKFEEAFKVSLVLGDADGIFELLTLAKAREQKASTTTWK
jgi:hypothetical protein